jgi:hypothetical protein
MTTDLSDGTGFRATQAQKKRKNYVLIAEQNKCIKQDSILELQQIF